jgi:RNA polymerase sigma-70 factor (ECF subfamily)
LPPGCRNVIELSYKDGLKIQEIADRLDVSPSTVKTQRARGLIILKKLLSSKALALAVMIAKFPG